MASGCKTLRWGAAVVLTMLCSVGSLLGATVRVTDDRGVTIELAQPPQRVVSLLPSITETVCALGACERLVGVDDYSNFPEPVRKLPHLGGLDDVRIEAVVALRPDLVLLSSTSPAIPRLQSLGIRVAGLDIKTLADLRRAFGTTGAMLGTTGADDLWARLQAGLDAAAAALPPALRGTRAYYEVSSGPYAASEASHIGELLARIGAANVVPARLGSVPKLNPEFVVRADPQVILIAADAAASLPMRPGWNRIRAVRDRRVCALTAAQSDVIARPGPRLAEGARVLVDCLQGRLPGPAS